MYNSDDVIAAVATPKGNAAIAVIRVSGSGAIALCDRVFFPLGGGPLSGLSGYRCTLGEIRSVDGEIIDKGIATVFRAPSSYTGEDGVELSCHGGAYVTERVLGAVLAAGARQAAGGEFSKRAFLNGKLGLTEAEAVMSVVSAQTDEALRLANRQSDGELARRISQLREAAAQLLIHISAAADFPDEEVPEPEIKSTADRLFELGEGCLRVAGTYEGGQAVSVGIDTVLAGKTNVGKSTLMNLLAGRERSIVSETAGTTRDVVETTVDCGGVLLRLADTAGLREASGAVEQRGVELASERISSASLIIAVFDGSRPAEEADMKLLKYSPHIGVINKTDKPQKLDPAPIEDECAAVVRMCAKTGDGLDALKAAVREVTGADDFADAGGWCATLHQRDCLRRAGEGLAAAATALYRGLEPDLAAVDIRAALDALDECTGKNTGRDVIDGIFETFCVGK